jgi:three-Cys-motif partner protein
VYDNGGEGSPVRALKAIVDAKKKYPSNTKVVLRLNDNDEKSIESVRQSLAQIVPGYERYCDVKYAHVDAEELLISMISWLDATRKDERNLLFIDPYGYKTIHRDALDGLMRNGKTEIILFLPVSFMHRFKDYALEADTEAIAPLKRFTEEFFPEGHPMRNVDEDMNVHEYIDNLKDAFSYGGKYYTSSYQIERERGRFFALFFMTSNLLGFEKILEVKWKLDEEDGNGFVLEKASPFVQKSLFEDDFAEAKRQEHSKRLRTYIEIFLEMPRNNVEMYIFVMRKGYLNKHATSVLKQMQDEGRLEVVNIMAGTQARKGSFYLTYEAAKNPMVKYVLK